MEIMGVDRPDRTHVCSTLGFDMHGLDMLKRDPPVVLDMENPKLSPMVIPPTNLPETNIFALKMDATGRRVFLVSFWGVISSRPIFRCFRCLFQGG